MKKIIIIGMACLLALSGILGCATEQKTASWDAVYMFDQGPYYWTFNQQGKHEGLQLGTYSFEQRDEETLIYLDYNEIEAERSFADSYVIKPGEDGYVELIPSIYFFDETADPYTVETSTSVLKYEFEPNNRDGLRGVGTLFTGTYHRVIDGEVFPATLEFYDNGVFVERVTADYSVIDEYILQIKDAKYNYTMDEDAGTLSVWTEEGQGTLDLHKMSSTDAVSYVMPNNGACNHDTPHEYAGTMTACFSEPMSDVIEEDVLYIINFCTDNAEITFSDIEKMLFDENYDQIPDVYSLQLITGDGTAGIGFFYSE